MGGLGGSGGGRMPKFLSIGPVLAYMVANHAAPAKLKQLPGKLDMPNHVKQRLLADGIIKHKERTKGVWTWDKGPHYPAMMAVIP